MTIVDACCCGGLQDRGCEGCPTGSALRRLSEKGTPCDRCNQGSWMDNNGIQRRCTYCRGTGRVTA